LKIVNLCAGTLIFPALSALMSHSASVDEQGNVQGALHGAQSLAQAFGLLVFPWIYSNASGAAAFVAGGCLNACAAALVAWRLWRVEKQPRGCGNESDDTLLPLNEKER
jgi:MFS family permease